MFFPNADAPMSQQEVIFFSRFVKAEDATKALKDFKINAFNRDLKVSPGSKVKLSHYQLESFENDDNVEQASKSQKKIDKKIWQQMLNDAQTNLEDGITSYQFIYVETHGKVRKGQSRSQFLGVVHKLRWQDFGFFWPPTPLRWHFLPYECWQKVDIFGLPTPVLL